MALSKTQTGWLIGTALPICASIYSEAANQHQVRQAKLAEARDQRAAEILVRKRQDSEAADKLSDALVKLQGNSDQLCPTFYMASELLRRGYFFEKTAVVLQAAMTYPAPDGHAGRNRKVLCTCQPALLSAEENWSRQDELATDAQLKADFVGNLSALLNECEPEKSGSPVDYLVQSPPPIIEPAPDEFEPSPVMMAPPPQIAQFPLEEIEAASPPLKAAVSPPEPAGAPEPEVAAAGSVMLPDTLPSATPPAQLRAPQVRTRVFLHVGQESDVRAARCLKTQLERVGYIVPGIEMVGAKAPQVSQLRYVYAEDEWSLLQANVAVASVECRGTPNDPLWQFKTQEMPQYRNQVLHNSFEIWFSEPKTDEISP